MNYYPHHIGDFNLHTSHLTLEEEGVYRRLLDYYYDTELPIPLETQSVIRRLRLGSHSVTVGLILEEFFHKMDDGWHNNRADFEIEVYQKKAKIAQENGRKGGRPKKNKGIKTQSVSVANPAETKSKANQEPITNNQEPNTKGRFTPPSVKEVAQYCQERNNGIDAESFVDYYGSANWFRGKTKIKDWKSCVRTWERNRPKPQQPSGGFEV